MATEFATKAQVEMEFFKANGEERKRRGMKKAVSHHKEELEYVQCVARFVGKHQELVTVDDVRNAVEGAGKTWTLHNAAGAIFQTHDWQFMGFIRSKRPAAHSRVIRTWRLKK